MIEIDILPASSEKKGGDSALIRIGDFDYGSKKNNQKVILIDSGYSENSERIKEYLEKYYQTNVIDLVIITHPDMDHISGFKALLDDGRIKIKETYIHDPWNHSKTMFSKTQDNRRTVKSLENSFEDTLKVLSAILDKLSDLKVKNTEPFGCVNIQGFNLCILGPDKKYYQEILYKFPGMEGSDSQTRQMNVYGSELKDYHESMDHFLEDPKTSSKNNSSVITLLQDDNGEPIVLFTGDAGVEAISKALDNADKNNIKYQGVYLFQIPHHGSIKNINQEVIDRIKPRNAYVSAPPKKEEHPSPLLINYFLKDKITTYHIKDKNGVVFYHDKVHSRPDWSAASTAKKHEKVYPVKSFFERFFGRL